MQLSRVRRLDSITLDETYYTDEGYLVDHPVVTTCGIFEYRNDDGSIWRELRLPEHVFAKESLKSYKGKPIIITHDALEVDKDNVRREQIGTIMSEGYRDGDSVRCEIIIHDTNALKRSGLRELSLGYSLDDDNTPGIWDGEEYDSIQTNIEINHLALVSEARAGESARLNIDGKDKTALKGGRIIMGKANVKGFRSDEGDLSPDEMEAAIALFKAQKAAEAASGSTADGDDEVPAQEEEEKTPADEVRANVDRRDSDGSGMTPEEIIAEQKEDLETLLAEIDRLQASSDMSMDSGDASPDDENKDSDEEPLEEKEGDKAINMDSVDTLLMARLDICRMAEQLNLDGVEKLSVNEGRRRIIKAVNPKMNLDGKSAAYVTAAYDLAKETMRSRKTTEQQRKSIMEGKMRSDAKSEGSSKSARKKMIENMTGGRK